MSSSSIEIKKFKEVEQVDHFLENVFKEEGQVDHFLESHDFYG